MRPHQLRAAEIARRLERAGISKAEAARRIGYPGESGRSYVRQVLCGTAQSGVVLDAIEQKVLAGAERVAA